nr:transient receptor potential cation channel, mucolipin ortholog [Cucujiformia]
HVNYTWDTRISFSHLFLRDWDATREINTYPPTAGPLAIYQKDDFYQTIDYAYGGYVNLTDAVGSYSYTNEDNTMSDIFLCLYSYKKGDIFGFNESYNFNSEIVKRCWKFSYEIDGKTLDSKTHLQKDVNFSALVRATLDFSVKTVNFKSAGQMSSPNCYQFDITILFDNEDHDGQMIVTLDAEPIRLNCKGDIEYVTGNEVKSILRSVLNLTIIFICVLSLTLCARAIWRAQQLRRVTEFYFKTTFNKALSSVDKRKFFNLWYVMIIVNDILIVVGSSIQEQIEKEEFTSDQWNACSLCLGLGNLLVWFGVLRYLGFFKTYNVVILTLEKAAPKVARFLLCAILIYAGFTFCGWLVLGPYHIKFKSLSTTSECLFSLINGDDMFAT